MCGRFTRMYTWEELVKLYRLTDLYMNSNLQPHSNICPTTEIDVVVRGDDARAIMPMRWGLVPTWWSKPLKEMKMATFNARAETVAEKPMFRDPFKKRRCLIPASGYYEWQTTPEGKQPYYFTRRDGQPITIAGLWSNWKDNATGEDLKSCTMVITEPNKFAGVQDGARHREGHHRVRLRHRVRGRAEEGSLRSPWYPPVIRRQNPAASNHTLDAAGIVPVAR